MSFSSAEIFEEFAGSVSAVASREEWSSLAVVLPYDARQQWLASLPEGQREIERHAKQLQQARYIHSAKGKATRKVWAKRNPDKTIAATRRWEAAHPEQAREGSRRRSARRRAKYNAAQNARRAKFGRSDRPHTINRAASPVAS